MSAPAWRQVAYLLAWPGMDAASFLQARGERVDAPKLREWLFAFAKLMLGLVLFFCIAKLVPESDSLLRGWVGIVGLAFVLHFGTFHILSCLWRSVGIDAVPLMDWPIASRSLSEFWGQRWNRGFRDFTSRFLFRPLARLWGSAASLAIGFLVSGVIHDIVISLTAQGGYGRPTLYFAIQGTAILESRSATGRSWGLQSGIVGWLFTFAVVVLPACLLFHPPFVKEVFLPFMTAVGALP